MDDFHANQPIFVQISQRLMGMILRGTVTDGDMLPSVRQISADLSVNPLTVTKAFDILVDMGVVEKRRGLGMFVAPAARTRLLAHEREKFLQDDWPRIAAQIDALELDLNDLLAAAQRNPETDA